MFRSLGNKVFVFGLAGLVLLVLLVVAKQRILLLLNPMQHLK
jgi:hypothetical protein